MSITTTSPGCVTFASNEKTASFDVSRHAPALKDCVAYTHRAYFSSLELVLPHLPATLRTLDAGTLPYSSLEPLAEFIHAHPDLTCVRVGVDRGTPEEINALLSALGNVATVDLMYLSKKYCRTGVRRMLANPKLKRLTPKFVVRHREAIAKDLTKYASVDELVFNGRADAILPLEAGLRVKRVRVQYDNGMKHQDKRWEKAKAMVPGMVVTNG